ncbi:MAG: hypothetical protein ACE5E7_11520 [Anaerolineae bacterium]
MNKKHLPFLAKISVLITLLTLFVGGSLHAQSLTATIGGSIYTGSLKDGTPNTTDATPLTTARVMVQEMETGAFVVYGTVISNTWTAEVPAPALDPTDPMAFAEYVVMFSAPGHDLTSRSFKVNAGDTVMQDAYLPPLYKTVNGSDDPDNELPPARLLAYAFNDLFTNGADDAPSDPPMPGVLLEVIDDEGNVVATGITGQPNPDAPLPMMLAGMSPGLYYFSGLKPGEYLVRATPPNIDGDPTNRDWYHTTTEEGSQLWEVVLYPGDPGTEDGAYLIWFGFVPKLGQLPPNSGTGAIKGKLRDAEGVDPTVPDPPEPGDPPDIFPVPGQECDLTTSLFVPEGYAVLLPAEGDFRQALATTEADPVTGVFEFQNIPPGKYHVFASDIPLEYVWNVLEVTVIPGTTANADIGFMLARFYARTQGYVYDGSTGLPMPGVDLKFRLEPHTTWFETTTDENGWYNFDDLVEVETMGYLEVVPPAGYKHMNIEPDPGATYDPNLDCAANLAVMRGKKGNRYIDFQSGFNYRTDLWLEPIPGTEDDIVGVTFYDTLTRGDWAPDGEYDEARDPIIQGVEVQLWDAAGTTMITSTLSGVYDEAVLRAQGWAPMYEDGPPSEMDLGGVYNGPMLGHFEFKGITPGEYLVKVVPPNGYIASTPHEVLVTAIGGQRNEVNFGLTTLVPIAGWLEGGVFDDLFVDTNPQSAFFEEKRILTGFPVVVYDHLGYVLDVMYQPSPLCYPVNNPGICDRPDLGSGIEIERRLAPGPREYVGNVPGYSGYDSNYWTLMMPYTFGQGTAKYEADWSLPSFGNGNGNGNGVPMKMHVTDLDAFIVEDGPKWSAIVNITVEDDLGPLPGAQVFGSWSSGETMTCNTDQTGQCIMISGQISDPAMNAISFTVNNVVVPAPSLRQYAPNENSDPDAQPEGPGATTSDGTTIIVSHSASQQAGTPIHVADLDGIVTVTETNPRKWYATVTVSVVDDNAAPVDGAVVYGVWTPEAQVSCTTGAAGNCSLVSQPVENTGVISVSFTVNDIQRAEPLATYNAAYNSDPDNPVTEHSDGTTITIYGTTDTTSSPQFVVGDADFGFLGTNGVEINPGQMPLGNTIVEILDQAGGSCALGGQATVRRCFTVSPENKTGRDATLRFYFNDTHLNGLVCENLRVWHYDGNGVWSLAGNGGGTPMCNPGGTSYVEVMGVTDFSDFALAAADNGPTAVSVLSTTASGTNQAESALIAALIALAALTLGSVILHRRREGGA